MPQVKKLILFQTSDGGQHNSSTTAKTLQSRLNLADIFGSEEWADTIGRIDPNILFRFLEQNHAAIQDFFEPQSMAADL
jgi:hypothetical protein